MTHQLTIGLFGIGLDTYWPQFEGLEARLRGYVDEVARRLARPGARVVSLGLIDSPEASLEAGHQLRRADVDVLFIYVTTYALSATVLPAVRRAGVPVVMLNLAPEAALDYERFNALPDRTRMTGEWLAYCAACPVPEIANVFRRAGIPFHQVTGYLHDDPISAREIEEWLRAAHVVQVLAHNTLGLMGNYYGGMLDIYTDLTLQLSTFGGLMKIVEVDELSARRAEVSETEVAARVALFGRELAVQPDCAPAELARAARTAVALDALVAAHGLGSLAYYHRGTGVPANEDTMSSVILGTSLLTARGVPVAGEYEVKNVQAMKILDALGAGGSFTEYYALDFADDVVLMGHDGPGHLGIAEGPIQVKPLQVYHGKVGRGLSVEMSVRHGPVTLLSVVENGRGGLFLLVAEGETMPGPVLRIGNTNSRYRFPLGARGFVEAWNRHGPAHHCAVGVGHHARVLRKLGALLNLEVVQVC